MQGIPEIDAPQLINIVLSYGPCSIYILMSCLVTSCNLFCCRDYSNAANLHVGVTNSRGEFVI